MDYIYYFKSFKVVNTKIIIHDRKIYINKFPDIMRYNKMLLYNYKITQFRNTYVNAYFQESKHI